MLSNRIENLLIFDNVKTGSTTLRKLFECAPYTKHSKIGDENYPFKKKDGDSILIVDKHSLDVFEEESKLGKTYFSDLRNITFIEKQDLLKNYTIVSTIRNPFDRLFSLFKMRLRHPDPTVSGMRLNASFYEKWLIERVEKSFPCVSQTEDVEHTNVRSLLDNICFPGSRDTSHINHFIRFESYEKDVMSLCEIVNLKIGIDEIPVENMIIENLDIKYKDYYTARSKQIIIDKYQDELNIFNYVF